MTNRRLPTTTYGYTPPPDARADGWRCFNDDCHAGGGPAPRRWPAACPECGGTIDPTFEEPWRHDAEGVQLAHQHRTSARATDREFAGAYLYSWRYKDALLRRDMTRFSAVKKEFGLLLGELSQRADRWAFQMALTGTAWDAVSVADLDFAADLLQAWHPAIHTDDVEENNQTRTEARSFVGACIRYLEHPESIGHAREQDVLAVMNDVKKRAWEILNTSHKDGLDRIHHLRAKVAEVTRIDQQDRDRISTVAFHAPLPHPSAKDWAIAGRPQAPVQQHLEAIATTITDAGSRKSDKDLAAAFDALTAILSGPPDEPTAHWAAVLLTDAAVLLADVHDDAAKLFTAADLLTAQRGSSRLWGTTTGLAHLLRAHGHIALMHNDPGNHEQHARAAQAALHEAKHLDRTAVRPILPAVQAVHGLLIVQLAQVNGEPDLHRWISNGIAECRVGRNAVAGLWRKTSGADIALARLLVWRALLVDGNPADRLADAQEAAQLARRWSRPGQPGPTSAQVVHNEALRAQDALAGGADPAKRAKNWRTAVTKAGYAPTAMRMRLAVAWVSWAVETDNPAFAAEAYEHLMSLIPLEAAARYRPEARQKVLSAAQEHTEEAGYWLARAGRYREAVVALETGRAISLSHLTSWDSLDLAARLERAGQSSLVAEYRGALADLAAAERTSTGVEGPDSPLQRAWVRARAVADRIAGVTGRHPLTSGTTYADIVQINDDGAVIYIAGAKASGYALVVAGRHDPQYIHLPEASRGAIEKLVQSMLPGDTDKRPNPFSITDGLRQLAEMGIREILLFHARGRAVTLVPVGQLSLIPLHATSDQRGNYLGDYSAIRYAPNVRTLLRCRETARSLPDRQLRLLAVNVPEAYGGRAKRLANVARETAEINRIWVGHGRNGRVVDDCTWEDFRRTASDYSVWHIASHGATSPHGPSGSRIYFADAEVTLERMAAELHAGPRRLAVLSACESHLTSAAVPNEVVGLPAMLLQLGFSGVVATAWQVNDVATTFLMTHFYGSLSRGDVPPVAALNLAQKWMRTATREQLAQVVPGLSIGGGGGEHPYANPYYWAAFAYTGA
jgi:CHAT domain-containing protein